MKTRLVSRVVAIVLPAFVSVASAAEPAVTSGWHPQSLGQALAYMLLFAAVGILAAIAGYKLFDRCTPGNLHHEIVVNKNIAAAIVGGAVILGVCIIIAAAMVG